MNYCGLVIYFGVVGIWFPSPCLQVMWSITWLVSVSPGRSTYPKVVRAHSNYVYKTCSMHQYELVPLLPNFHHSSYFKPTNRKSEHQYYLPLCTVGASSTGVWWNFDVWIHRHFNGVCVIHSFLLKDTLNVLLLRDGAYNYNFARLAKVCDFPLWMQCILHINHCLVWWSK